MPDPSEPAASRRNRPTGRQLVVVSIAVVSIAVVIGAVVVLVGPKGSPAEAAAADAITVSHTGCGSGWTDPHGGAQSLTLKNDDSVAGEADLVAVGGPNDGKVYGEIEGMGPGTTVTMRVTLGPGSYAIRCVMEDLDPVTGRAVRIGGNARSNAGAAVVTSTDLLGPLKAYQAYLVHGVAVLVTRTDALAASVRSGNLTRARTDWLAAHLRYETLGAAYDAFGDYDGEINGTTAGLPGGVHDPDFTGFHRVEYGLWHGESAASLARVTDQLDSYVHGLRHDLPQVQPQALDIGLRAHEIMENTLQFELTGRTDYGSHSNLATASANLAGDREVISVLRPLLTGRYPRLSEVDTWANRLRALLDAQHHGATWTPVTQLSRAAREKLDGTLSQLVEYLAPVAAITEPRRTTS
ncbi:MAG TPA: EfeM/EfeO family lipoprotein [Pseudonocardiaceae bacterium]|nr:EfeM/EfeO family lipoprotein [Pseudonocardiaceae bacterium]